MDWLNNICWLTDSYKVTHWKQYPPGTTRVYSYFESRRGAIHPQTVFFGLHYILRNYLAGRVVTQAKIDAAQHLFRDHFGKDLFNRRGWEHILHKHEGRLPVVIKAVREGTIVSENNVLMTIENTDPECFWLTNWLETILTHVWYPSTVATQSRAMKNILLRFLHLDGDPNLIDYKLHCFGFRGVSCVEQAAIGNAAHLLSFRGTDTPPGMVLLNTFYGGGPYGDTGHSIPAAEHSTITSWGKDHEVDAYANMLEQYPDGLVAFPIDSYDAYVACSNHLGETLKDKIITRDGVTVVRPDSGHAQDVIPELLCRLKASFGAEKNKKGYWVLNPKIRLIQGDGVEYNTLASMLDSVHNAGFSTDNISFGSGGGLLQKLNRDVQRFAFKCSSVQFVSGYWRDVCKDPETDHTKRSKAGRFKLVYDCTGAHGPALITVPINDGRQDQLERVFENGEILSSPRLDGIRSRAA